jgi:outer membrane protein
MIQIMGRVALVAAGWLSFSAAEVSAEPVTLGQAYALALQQGEDVRIGEESVRQAKEDIIRARSTVLPQVTLKGNYTRYPEEVGQFGILQPGTSYGAEATLEQAIFAGGKNKAGLSIAKRSVQSATADIRLVREQLLLRVAAVFYSVLRAQKNVEIQTRNVERLAEHRRLSELRYKVGEVTESILLRAEAELAGAGAELVARQNDLAIARRELQLLTNLPDSTEVVEPALPQIVPQALDDLRAAAREHRDDLLKSQLQERIARDRVAFARGSLFPSVTAEGSYSRRAQNPETPFFIGESWFIGGRVEFPLFDGGLRRAELRQAKSRLEQGRLTTTRLAEQIDLDVTRASLTLEAVTRVLQSRQDQHRFAAKNFEMVSKQFTFGLATNLDVLDANQTLIEAERDVIAGTYDRHLAILELQRSAGRFLTEAEQVIPKETM